MPLLFVPEARPRLRFQFNGSQQVLFSHNEKVPALCGTVETRYLVVPSPVVYPAFRHAGFQKEFNEQVGETVQVPSSRHCPPKSTVLILGGALALPLVAARLPVICHRPSHPVIQPVKRLAQERDPFSNSTSILTRLKRSCPFSSSRERALPK